MCSSAEHLARSREKAFGFKDLRWVAGAPGFEPGNGGTKNRCLTAWRRPNEMWRVHNRLKPDWQLRFAYSSITARKA